MKYIRTNERIIEFKQYDEVRNRATELGLTYTEKILKTANTIEELCDEYVFICKDLKQPQLVIPMNFEYCKKEFKDAEIYGAMWTYGGLVYVAKMDKEGQFQLWNWWEEKEQGNGSKEK